MNRLFGDQSGRTLSLVNMCFGLGAFAGPLIAAAVLAALHDDRPIFAGIGALLIVPLVIYARCPAPGPTAHVHAARLRLPRAAIPAVILLAALMFLYLGVEIGFAGWIYVYVDETSQAGSGMAAWAPACFWLALSASSLLAAVRPRRWRPEWLVFVSTVGSSFAVVGVLGMRGHAIGEIVATAAVRLFLDPFIH